MSGGSATAGIRYVPDKVPGRPGREERDDPACWLDASLRCHVRDGRVDYAALAADTGFSRFIEWLAAAEVSATTNDVHRLAFHINAYNAFALQAVLEGLSPATLAGRLRFFLLKRFTLAGERLSLLGLERRRIIAAGDPRIHFAIVCASASCPALRNGVYRGDALDRQLDEDARRFVNDPRRNSFDLVGRQASVSRIFRWYASEFRRAAGSVRDYLAGYVRDAAVADALRAGALEIRYRAYDWSVNTQKERASPPRG